MIFSNSIYIYPDLRTIWDQLRQINLSIEQMIESQQDRINERHEAYSHYERAYAQEKNGFKTAYSELYDGKKKEHWMWYIFPNCKWKLLQITDNGQTSCNPPSSTSLGWFIPDTTGIPFLLYNIDNDQVLIRRLYGMMRIACAKLCPSYNREVFFDYTFGRLVLPKPIGFPQPITGNTLFSTDLDYGKFYSCVEFFLKAVAAILNRYEIPKVAGSIWRNPPKILYEQEIQKYHKAVQKAQPMEPYHELFHLLQHIYTTVAKPENVQFCE